MSVGEALLFIGEGVLPVGIGHLAVCDVSFQSEPSSCTRYAPVVAQCQSHLRHWSGVYSQGLRTRAQRGVLQFHGPFLAAHGEGALQPAPLHISLLNDGLGGVVHRHRHVQGIAHAPFAFIVMTQRALHGSAKVTIGLVERRQAVLIGIEPEGCLTLAHRGLSLDLVLHPVERMQRSVIVIVLLRHNRST